MKKNEENSTDLSPKAIFEFNNDLIECKKGDSIYASIVTGKIAYDTEYTETITTTEGETIIQEVTTRTPLKNSIIVTEIDNNGIVNGSYKYDIPYGTSAEEKFETTTVTSADSDSTTTTVKNFNYDYSLSKYPSTNALKHIVVHETTSKIKLTLNAYFPLVATIDANNTIPEDYTICALLVEKNT